MKTNFTRAIGFFFLFVLIGTMANAQKATIDAAFADAAAKGFSGVVVVAKNGKILFEGVNGYRHFETKEPLEASDIFELASVSKQFTAMAIMQLHEKGLLQYDDLLEKYIEVPYKGITIRHLLQHTSGLPDYQALMDNKWDKTKVAGNAEVIDFLNRYAPIALFKPGEKYEYSNTGYLLLASVAEKVSGKDFIDLCRSAIFRKIKMKDTDIRSLEAKALTPNFAAGHLPDSLGQYINANKFHSSDYTVWLGNRKGPGRISSTAADLLKWDKALYTSKLVKQASLDTAFTPARLNDGSTYSYGFGWDIEWNKVLGKIVKHNGDNPGYSTQIIRLIDKKTTIIALCNNAHSSFTVLIDAIMKSLE
jgi:CubicO group peptidase (beta-lactamase class C family)